jgi:hypothetical protein
MLCFLNSKVPFLEPGVTATAGEVSWVCSALLGNSYFPPPEAIKLMHFLKGFKLLLLPPNKAFFPFQNELHFQWISKDIFLR